MTTIRTSNRAGETIAMIEAHPLPLSPSLPGLLASLLSPPPQDDILCVAYCPPHYLATGSFDGEITVWNANTEKVASRFHSMTRIKPQML